MDRRVVSHLPENSQWWATEYLSDLDQQANAPPVRVLTPSSTTTAILSLQELCVSKILHNPSIETLLTLQHVVQVVPPSSDDDADSSMHPLFESGAIGPEHRTAILRLMKERFALLIDKVDDLESHLGSTLFNQLKLEHEEKITENSKFRSNTSSGSVVEPKQTDHSLLDLTDWVSSESLSLPLSALVKGQAYPKGMVIAKREQYLSDSEFVTVFGMTKVEFAKLDKYKKKERKEAKNLW
jgi:hypothetical protein